MALRWRSIQFREAAIRPNGSGHNDTQKDRRLCGLFHALEIRITISFERDVHGLRFVAAAERDTYRIANLVFAEQ